MKTIVALEDFSGYPQGNKAGSKRHDFAKGDELDVPDAFADMVVAKGHAKERVSLDDPKVAAKQAANAKAEAKANAKAAAAEAKE